MLSTILIVLLILLLIGALPTWPYSASWGYGPGGLLGTVLVVVLILEPDSKDNYRASRLTAIWMQASVTKAARVRPRFS
jgi:hypothetical protein